MKRTKNLLAMLFVGIILLLVSCRPENNETPETDFELPKGWFVTGDSTSMFNIGIDKGAGQDGKNAATIKTREILKGIRVRQIQKTISQYGTVQRNISEKSFVTLMQDCLPDKFLGKRVRMTGMLKTEQVDGWAGLWLRIDVKTDTFAAIFDNMKEGIRDRSIRGTNDWKKYDIVLNVPSNAINMAYGGAISGTGQIWFDNLTFEVVDTNSVTGVIIPSKSTENISHFKLPFNTDFEDK